MNLRSTVIFTLFFSIFVFIFSFSIEENKNNLKSSNYCNQLTYKESLNIHPNKFSSISIEVSFESERDWRRSIFSSFIKSKVKSLQLIL